MNIKEARKLKKTKVNAKAVLLSIMQKSSIDFSVEHAEYKLSRYGFGSFSSSQVRKCMDELCDSMQLVFNGYKPIRNNGHLVGYNPIFGLPANR